MNIITAQELKSKLDNNEAIQLIDLREDYEFEDFNIGGTNIPMDQVLSSLDQINTNSQVVFCCRTGRKSAAIILTLQRKFNLKNLFSLKDGLEGYLTQV